jgi:hypothetical protein
MKAATEGLNHRFFGAPDQGSRLRIRSAQEIFKVRQFFLVKGSQERIPAAEFAFLCHIDTHREAGKSQRSPDPPVTMSE